jgi:hypothetical protein
VVEANGQPVNAERPIQRGRQAGRRPVSIKVLRR